MDIYVLNSSLEVIGVVDDFDSLIWTDRFFSYGDFEITKIPDQNFIYLMTNGMFLTHKDSEHIMLIENINIQCDIENGNRIIVKGRSIEFLLDRRIVWDMTTLRGTFQDSIEHLFIFNVTEALDVDRRMSLIEFAASTDPAITSLQMNNQFLGTSIYKVVQDGCIERNVGFKLTLTEENKFRFTLYAGLDRSYNQIVNPYVIFSPQFDNLINSDYTSSDEYLRTVALVLGEEVEGVPRAAVVVEISPDGGSDLLRRELFVDANDIRQSTPEGDLSDDDYADLLVERGSEELAKNSFVESFQGQADTTRTYIYGTDFYMGDIVQVSNEYGNEGTARIIELIFTQDSSGSRVYPTFLTIT